MEANHQSIPLQLEIGAGESIKLVADVWQDGEGQWSASAPTHYPPLPPLTEATPVKALAALQVEVLQLARRRREGAADLRAKIDAECGPEDFRAVRFTFYWNLLQSEQDFGRGWQEEAVRELLALCRSLARDGRRASETNDFLLWLGKRVVGEATYSNPTKAEGAIDSLLEWHKELAARATNKTPWGPRRDGNRHKPIDDHRRANLVEELRKSPYVRNRKRAETAVGTGAKGAVDREAARKKPNP